jgi:hypothetical protein
MRRFIFKPPILATLVLTAVIALTFAIRSSESKTRLSVFEGDSAPFEFFVLMPFEPEAFHITELQSAGRIVGIEGERVHLRAVKQSELKSLSWKTWITGFEPVAESDRS